MSDWEPQEDWSTVNIGDQVRVKRNGGMLTGKVIYRLGRECDPPWGIELDVATLAEYVTIKRHEWSLFVPAKPAVELPTEVGFYLDKNGALATLNDGGIWRDSYEDFIQTLDITAYAPFTKLEPVAVTAKKMIAALSGWSLPSELTNRLRKEFGVTDE